MGPKKLTPWDPEAKTEGTVNCEINHRCHMRGFEMGPKKNVICEALRWDRKKLTPWAPEAKTEGTVNCEINHRCHMRGFEMGPKKLTPWDPEAKTEEL